VGAQESRFAQGNSIVKRFDWTQLAIGSSKLIRLAENYDITRIVAQIQRRLSPNHAQSEELQPREENAKRRIHGLSGPPVA